MGQRLNLELVLNGKAQANAYYHWSGYTGSALRLTQVVLANEQNITHENAVIRAVRLLEETGAGLTEQGDGNETNEIEEVQKLAPNETFRLARSRNDGLIAVTEEGMEDTRTWEEARVTIDFDTKTIDFSAVYHYGKETYLEEYELDEADYEKIEVRDYDFSAIPFEAFDAVAEDIIAIMDGRDYEIRLQDGDVVSFIA